MSNETIIFSARAGLVALGIRFQQLKIRDRITETVIIHQKVWQHTPLNKLLDCFINILAGGAGVVEVNTRVRPDIAVQRAFGRNACAEQSTISDTLNACTPDTIDQQLSTAAGRLDAEEALRLLQDVSQPNTQWSIVYGLSTGEVLVTMGRAYDRAHTFAFDLAD